MSADAVFAAVAQRYRSLGWSPLPLEPGTKSPPPTGYTGYKGKRPDERQVRQWCNLHPAGNVALRLPSDVVGIDVDAYHGGLDGLDGLEAAHGALPPTWASTSRQDGSGIRLFRVPIGWHLRTDPAHGVDMIQAHHRYVVAAPSLHPEGRRYRWVDLAAGELADVLEIEPGDLPELPWGWLEGLKVDGAGKQAEVAATTEEVAEFLDTTGEQLHLPGLTGWRRKLGKDIGSRHDHLLTMACWAMREAAAGWYPAVVAVKELEAWWHQAMSDDVNRRDGGEFGAAVAWAIAEAKADAERVAALRSQVDLNSLVLHGQAPSVGSSSALGGVDVTVPASWTDAHVGEAFGSTLAGRWLYCKSLGGWLRWDGKRWALDQGEGVFEECRQWVIATGEALWKSGDGKVLQQVAKYRERPKIDAVVTIARRLAGITARVDEFDQHPHLLNVGNGVADLRDGTLRPHDPALRLTKLAGADYVPDARHSDVEAVLGAVSAEVRAYLQRLFGSALVGEVVDDKVPVLDGPGANGKTTLLKAVSAAAGDYAATVPTRLLIARATHDEHPTLIANLHGKRLAIIEETPEGGSLRMEQLKALSGGGELSARFIGGNYFTFKPSHQFVIATNHRPAVNASDYAAWRRLELVPFPHTYRPAHAAREGDRIADPDLRRRVTFPAQRAAVLAWLVAGAVVWHRNGLGACDEVRTATDAWRRDEDVIHAWWADCVTPDPDGSVLGIDLYQSYTAWCSTVGRPSASNKEFVKRFVEHDIYRDHSVGSRKTMAGKTYAGLVLNPDPGRSMTDMTGGGVVSQEPPREESPPNPSYPSYPQVTAPTPRRAVVNIPDPGSIFGDLEIVDDEEDDWTVPTRRTRRAS